jgi:hypothetical protein
MNKDKVIEWPICPNYHAQRAKDFEDWCRIQGVDEKIIGKKAYEAVKKWFEEEHERR